MDWIDLAQDKDQWRALVNTIMKHLSSCTIGVFSRWAQLHVVIIIIISSSSESVYQWATGWMAGVRFPGGQGCSVLHSVQTGAEAHLASYPMGTWDCFPGGKATEA
jgi:hypothetical protein